MAWTTPKTFSSAVATSAEMNTHLRDNLNELRGGGVAIASQAASDYVTASSSTQLARKGQASVVLEMQVFGG